MIYQPVVKSLSNIVTQKCIIVLFFGITLCANSWAGIPQYETTRLKSTAGAGVASLLLDEASILNPAPLAFFNSTAIYVQKAKISVDQTSENGPTNTPEPDLFGVIASDAKGALKGSISYQKQKHLFDTRKRYAIALAAPVSQQSSMGVTYRYTKDNLSSDGVGYRDEKYHQTVFGFFHAISENFSTGMTVIDPLKSKNSDTEAIIGFQYVYKDFVMLLLDGGANYREDLSDTLLYRGALQLKVFSDFYARVGTFNDKGRDEKGSGAGLSWIQPRLVLEIAIKNTTVNENSSKNQLGEKIKETSFSLALHF